MVYVCEKQNEVMDYFFFFGAIGGSPLVAPRGALDAGPGWDFLNIFLIFAGVLFSASSTIFECRFFLRRQAAVNKKNEKL